MSGLSARLHYHARYTVPATLSLLPPTMDTLEARAMLLAIGIHESQFKHRHQIGGPARGFWQFELGGGVAEVLTHTATRRHIERVLDELRYLPAVNASFLAIEHNDVLACAFARLLLWTVPGYLPQQTEAEKAYRQYLAGWRPNPLKTRPQEWAAHYGLAWSVVLERRP